tara:strand:+ start:144 stop:557 length:414 start_codon:yes stop_codon:yes gene_type:complete
MSERSTKWQRDNFSNKQILEYLTLLKIEEDTTHSDDREIPDDLDGWNEAIDTITDMFYCLDLPDEEFGAMAFNKETNMFEHIGKEPEDAKQIRLDKEKELRDYAPKSVDTAKYSEITVPALSSIFEGASEYSIPLAD